MSLSKFDCISLSAATLALVLTSLSAAGPSFAPDSTFKGSSLSGWQPLGQAEWRAQNGEISGTPKSAAGGWLVLGRSCQDVAFYASFRCTGECRTGILLRAEKTSTGMKGIYVALVDGEVASYRVALDAQGKELQRER